ncbi:MAG: hypothetical protein GAK29_00870 [Acinetobacter bereziniae]|uniref:Phage FluMu protein gp47 n=1 Tax=Acinetobacter bereziniae TaxID=106648 RepID=A0A833PJ89_ACIBZ|nr:MAG: hypothetical protein GAK29_00870 [Acinetobacter bereziniae]
MAFIRPSLSELIKRSLQNIISSLPNSDALLRFSNLNVLGTTVAGMTHQHYGYLDYIALQATPYTATDEYLAAWGALRGVYRKAATQALGTVQFPAVVGAVIPNDTKVIRSDSKQYIVIDSVQTAGLITVTVEALADPNGLNGVDGNCEAGTQFSLEQSISGVNSSGISGPIVGGADIESEEDFKARVIAAYQSTPQGGAKNDYEEWATEVPSVTRAWCVPLIYGAGTVGVYFLVKSSDNNLMGLPQGSNGVANAEERDTPATGDQLIVANYIYPLRPTTALVYALSPTLEKINLSIQGVRQSDREAVRTSLQQSLLNNSAPGRKVQISSLWAAVDKVESVNDFNILSPNADVPVASSSIAVLGDINWS